MSGLVGSGTPGTCNFTSHATATLFCGGTGNLSDDNSQ